MATAADILSGLEFLVREAQRLTDTVRDDEWALVQDLDGWKNTQVLAHIAGTGTIVPMFAQQIASAEPGVNPGAGIDIDQINAGIVAARADKSVADLMQEIRAAYAGVAEWVRQQPEDLWQQRRSMIGFRDVTLGDLLMRMVVMHGLGHVYSVYASIGLPVKA